MHPARILLHASLAVLEAFKLEGRLVVLATFGGPMQSKFRLFVGSALLFALSACGQGAPTAPVAGTIAPFQYGDGIYALRLLPPGFFSRWHTVGFVRVHNLKPEECNLLTGDIKVCDISEWVLSVEKMKELGKDESGEDFKAELPLPAKMKVKLDFTEIVKGGLDEATAAFLKSRGEALADDSFKVFRVISSGEELKCTGDKLKELKDCRNAPPSNGSGSGSGEPK